MGLHLLECQYLRSQCESSWGIIEKCFSVAIVPSHQHIHPISSRFVSYKTMQEAQHAIELFHNYELGKGVRLTVKVREKKEDKEKRQAQVASDRDFCKTLNCTKDNSSDEEGEEKDGGVVIDTSELVRPRNAMDQGGDLAKTGTPTSNRKQVDVPPGQQNKAGGHTQCADSTGATPTALLPCVVCRKPCKTKCVQCKTLYCSKPCQQQDWPKHKYICGTDDATRQSSKEKDLAPDDVIGGMSERGGESHEATGYDDDEYDVSVPDELLAALTHYQNGCAPGDTASPGRSSSGLNTTADSMISLSQPSHTTPLSSISHTTPISISGPAQTTPLSIFSGPSHTTPLSIFSGPSHTTPLSISGPAQTTPLSISGPAHTTPLSISRSLSLGGPHGSVPLLPITPLPTTTPDALETRPAISSLSRLGLGVSDTVIMDTVRPLLYSFPMMSSVPLDAPLPKVFRALATMVVSPTSFHAIVLCVETKELLRRLDALIVEGQVMGVEPDELTLGTRCGFRTEEGVVVRVKVTGFSQDRVKLVSYDFGGHFESLVVNLVMLPEALLSAPSLMVTCILSSSEYGLGTVAANQLKELITGKVLKISWNPTTSADATSRTIRCKCEVQGAVNAGEVWPPTTPTLSKAPPTPTVSTTMMEPLRRTNPAGKVCFHLPPRTGTFVICPHVVHSPSSMWILVQHQDITHFKRLQDDLKNRYQYTHNNSYVPERGEMCAVWGGEDGTFYRAEVVCVNNDGNFDVQYVDFGNCETVGLDKIRHLDQVFMTLPRQALRAALAGIAPLSPTDMWSTECVFHLRKKMIGQHFVAKIVAESKGAYYLSVQDPDSSPTHFINNGLVDLGYAKYIQGHFEGDGVYMSQVPCLPSMMMEVLFKQNKTPCDTSMIPATSVCLSGKASPIATPPTTRVSSAPLLSLHSQEGVLQAEAMTTKQAVKQSTSSLSFSMPSVETGPNDGGPSKPSPNGGGPSKPSPNDGGPSKPCVVTGGVVFPKRKLPVIVPPLDKVLNVQATHIETPYAFWLQMADPQSKKKLNDLTTAMNKTTPTIMTNPTAGSLCLARSCVDSILHRGQVASVSNTGLVKVQFLDYGSKEDVAGKEVYEVGSISFVELSAQAMFCTLNSLLHPRGKDASWEPREVEVFESLLPLETQLRMKVAKTIGTKNVVDVMVPSEAGDSDLLTLCCKVGLGTTPGEGPRKSAGFSMMKNKEKKDGRSDSKMKDEGNSRQSNENTKFGKGNVGEGPVRGGLGTREPPAVPKALPAILTPTRPELSEDSAHLSDGSSPMLGGTRHPPTSLKSQCAHTNIKASDLPVTGIFKDDNYTLITVTTVDTPHSFYIQAVAQSSLDELNQLSAHLSAITSPSQLVKSSVAKGDLCCAKFSKDGSWYRAEVKEILDSHCVVHFLDYGNTERVLWSDIVHCPVECTNVPIQAIRCALYGVVPLDSKWSPPAVEAMQKLTVDKPLLGQAHGQLPDGSFSVELMDTSGEKDVNIAAELVLGGVAASSKPPVVTPKKAPAKPNIKVSNLPVAAIFSRDKEFSLVTVTTVDTPHCFYLQAVTQSSVESLTLITNQLQLLSSASSSQLLKSSVAKGDLCCAKFSKDGSWYRAEVKEISDTHCVVHFLDYGNTERVLWPDIVHCPVECTNVPIQAIRCALYGVVPLDSKWSPPAAEAMKELTVDKVLHARVGSEAPLEVELVNTSGDRDINIAMELIAMELAASPLSPEAQPTVPSIPRPPHLPSIPPPHLPSETFRLYISDMTSPSSFYIHHHDITILSELQSLMDQLQVAYASPAHYTPFQAIPGASCCAQFTDGAFYRCLVVKVDSLGVTLNYVDYGSNYVVPASGVFRLDPKFASLPAMAVHCSLADVCPNMKDQWSHEAVQSFKALVFPSRDDITLLKGKVVVRDTDPVKIQLFLLDSGQSCVANMLVDKSVAISSNSLVQPGTIFNLASPTLSQLEFPVIISHVESPTKLYINPLGPTYTKMAAGLQGDINAYSTHAPSFTAPPKPGSLAIGQYKNGSWFRVRILQHLKTPGKLEVQYVDYGNLAVLSLEQLKPFSDQFMSIPEQIFQCALYGITAQEALAPSSDLKQAVSSLSETEHICHVVYHHPLIVALRPSGNHGNQGAATVHSWLVCQKLLPQSTLLQLPCASISSEGSSVLPTVVVGPGDFWVQVVDDAEKLAILLERMNQFCNSRPLSSPVSPLVLGQLCCAKFSEDGCWYRARVVDFRGKAEVKVGFVDFGNAEWTSLEHIQEMREDFACLPKAAVHCCLIGYESKAMCDGEVARAFKSLVENKKLVAIKKGDMGIFQTVVELVDTSSEQDIYIHKVISSP